MGQHQPTKDQENDLLEARWEDALLAARMFAVDPAGLCLVIKAQSGPVRSRFLSYLRSLFDGDMPFKTMPNGIMDDRLIGGIDLGATLKAGKPHARAGLLAEADGGVVLATMAERMSLDAASRLAAALDFKEVKVEREGMSAAYSTHFGVIALDEGEGDETLPPALSERLAFMLDLTPFSIHVAYEPIGCDHLNEARSLYAGVHACEAVLSALTGLSIKLGIWSLRVPMMAVKAAKAYAALSGRDEVGEEDVAAAVRLVLAPRATQLPMDEEEEASPPEEETPPPPEPDNDNQNEDDVIGPLDDVVLEAVKAGLPPGLLAKLTQAGKQSRGQGQSGRQGAQQNGNKRGRPLSSRRGELRPGKKLDVIGTLRAAAPWQDLRRAGRADHGDGPRFEVRPDDFQIMRIKERRETATIFAVDASGSTALSRLGEAKGAVELLLAESYARRDHVALISFRGQGADMLLAPTRSLVRAKRALSALPGGGGTPLASGLELGLMMAEEADRKGRTPTLVLLTDGSANINLDGEPGRKAAFDDALQVAHRLAMSSVKVLVVDIAKRKSVRAQELAAAMDGTYVPLPNADARSLSNAVKAAQTT